MIEVLFLAAAMLSPRPLPPPPLPPEPLYPFDSSIECFMHDWNGALVATWAGELIAEKTEISGLVTSRFQLHIASDNENHQMMPIPEAFPVPVGQNEFIVSVSPANFDESGIPKPRSFDDPKLHYRFETLFSWAGGVNFWLAYLSKTDRPIAAGICRLEVIRQASPEGMGLEQ